MSGTLQWLLTAGGILIAGAGCMVLIDVLDVRRRRRIHAKLDAHGRKRLGL